MLPLRSQNIKWSKWLDVSMVKGWTHGKSYVHRSGIRWFLTAYTEPVFMKKPNASRKMILCTIVLHRSISKKHIWWSCWLVYPILAQLKNSRSFWKERFSLIDTINKKKWWTFEYYVQSAAYDEIKHLKNQWMNNM